MRFSSKMIAALGLALVSQAAFANVKLANVFTDNMVLQRDKSVGVWGQADPGENVTVSFAGQNVKATADALGNWMVKLAPLAMNKTASEMTVKGKNTIQLKNILVGDVWLCSGQSNMEMSFGWGIMDGNTVKKNADQYSMIRHIKFAKVRSNFPVKNPRTDRWKVCSSKTLNNVTATGYFFALAIHKETGIPIGILDDNWSGCRIEPFIAPEGVYAVPELKNAANALKKISLSSETGKKLFESQFKKGQEWLASSEKAVQQGVAPYDLFPGVDVGNTAGYSQQYFAMVAPIVNFPIKGAIWYQGESNGGEGDSYYFKTKALVEGWRKVWNDDFPFYWVQLSSFQGVTNDPQGGNGWAKVREAQRRAMSIPKTGMAVTIDIGNARDIHPKNKQDVGGRLALWALNFDYGKKCVYSGPLYKNMKVEGNKIRVSFDQVGSGLMAGVKKGLAPTAKDPAGKLKSFAVAGADKKWHWADAVIDGDTVVVSSPEVKNPVAVRYAFRMNPGETCNLYNKEGLPASPFRTDKW